MLQIILKKSTTGYEGQFSLFNTETSSKKIQSLLLY